MIALALALFIGIIIGALLPDKVRGWVRDAWEWARGVFVGISKNPASLSATHELIAAANATTRIAPKLTPQSVARGAANILGFLWRWKWAFLVVALFLLVSNLTSCSPFGLGKSRDALRLEREIAEANARVAQHETRLSELSRDLAVNTERDRRRRAEVIADAEQDIDNAAAQVDPDALYDAYVRGYLCVLDATACEGRANPAPSGPPAMRGAGADPA